MRLAVVCLLLTCPAIARAHSVGLVCEQRGSRLKVAVFYSDDTPARSARVRLLDSDRQVLEETVTDADGRCELRAPAPGPYQVAADAGEGHRATRRIVVRPHGDANEVQVSDGPSRSEFTRFPILRVVVGVAVIALLAMGAIGLRNRLRGGRPGS